MISFVVYFFLCAAGLFISTLLLSSLGDAWLIFSLILGGAALASLRLLWEKLERMERKLDKLLEQRNDNANE